ncbi:MAG: acetyl-CoA decarbonylase/synthase complex subunit delta [Deltaproteobacteria bacterium]|nr:acetyl-CoA decarbonylase/synthase complex subunit delta [Deltaproteobacteria bacterium]
MAFEIPKQPYSGEIGETIIGKGDKAIKIGGEDSYPFHIFEGKMPNPPKIAMEIWDYDPSKEWPASAVEPFKDVISSADAWAKKCVDEYGTDIIVLQLKSIDPNGMDRKAEEAAKIAKKVVEAVDVPVVFWGTANNQKDEEVLKKISEICEGMNCALGPVEEGNHKGVGASALGYGQCIVSSSPIDVNLAKQLNILLGNLGVKRNKILIDPTTGGLGYGMEYSYSVMERIRMAALTQEDDKLQIPMINNIGNEIWKSKEAGQSIEEAPTLGDPEKRAILMECTAASCYLLAGSDIVILRHPESVRLIRSFIDIMINGGMAVDIEGISKRLDLKVADLVSISPEPNLDFGKGEVAEKKKTPEPKKKAAPKPEQKEEKPTAKPKPAEKSEEKAPKPLKVKEDKEKKSEETEKAQAEKEAQAEAEAKAKAEAEAKAKEEAEVKAKAEAEAKAKAKKAEEEAKEASIRERRAKEREELAAKRKSTTETAVKKTASTVLKSQNEKILERLNMIHRRIPLY